MTAQEILPSNIAKTPDIEILQELNDTLLLLANAIAARMPRTDTGGRMLINSDLGNGLLCQVVNVTALGNLTNLNNFAGGNTVMIPQQMSQAGLVHLYQGIQVS